MLEIGIKGTSELVVTENLLANQVGSGLVAVCHPYDDRRYRGHGCRVCC